MGLTDYPTCERCLEEDESATHVLCDGEAIYIAHLSYRYLGRDFYDAPIGKVLHLIRRVGLLNRGLIKNKSAVVPVQRAGRGPPLIYYNIHSLQ
jgi:hypothetical protein